MLKYLLLLLVLFGVSFSQPVAAYNFAPPIEPVAKQKITLKSVKSTLALQKAKWQAVQAKPNKTTANGDFFAITALILYFLSLVGLPLGYGLGLTWLLISSLSAIASTALAILIMYIIFSMDAVGIVLGSLVVIIFITLGLIDMIILSIIAWLPWFWIVFAALGLLLGLLFWSIYLWT